MANFDNILKKGKQSTQNTPSENLTRKVGNILWMLEDLNENYNKDEIHPIIIRNINCVSCSVSGFVVIVPDINDKDKLLKFHDSKWKASDPNKDKFFCPKCSGN